VQRWGATPEMVIDTVNHFAFACAVMAAGMEWDLHNEKFQGYNHRDEYTWRGDVVPAHGEAFVQIFTNQFPIWLPHKLMRYPLNVMTEDTSAGAIYEAFQDALTAEPQVAEICNRLKPANAPQKASSAPTRPAPAQQGLSELDKHFGPKNGAPAPVSTGLPDGVEPGDIGQPPIIRSWDYKLEDEYNQFFSGKRVDVEVGKVERVIVAKQDGSGSYEVVRVWPFYNGEFPKYCPFPLSFFVDTEPRDYSDWKTFAKDWGPYFPRAGSSHTGHGVARFKVSPSKKEGDDRVFWNFQSLTFDEPFEPSDAVPFEPAGPDIGDGDNMPLMNDVPF